MTPRIILLVDDDTDCRTLMRDAIDECHGDYTVYEVTNGQQAMEFLTGLGAYAGSPRPNLIFLDVEMPQMDGQETLRQIRSHPEFREIPVVMMTGLNDDRQMRQAAMNGANSYTLKPASAAQFLHTVTMSLQYWLEVHQYPSQAVCDLGCWNAAP